MTLVMANKKYYQKLNLSLKVQYIRKAENFITDVLHDAWKEAHFL